MNRQELRIAAKQIREGNPRYVGVIIRFLDKDEYRFGSGYAKEYSWQILKRVHLTERQKERLCNIALRYLRKPLRREFWYMCRFIRGIANESFRARVMQMSGSKDEDVRKRAALLQAYLESPERGEQARRAFRSMRLRLKSGF